MSIVPPETVGTCCESGGKTAQPGPKPSNLGSPSEADAPVDLAVGVAVQGAGGAHDDRVDREAERVVAGLADAAVLERELAAVGDAALGGELGDRLVELARLLAGGVQPFGERGARRGRVGEVDAARGAVEGGEGLDHGRTRIAPRTP